MERRRYAMGTVLSVSIHGPHRARLLEATSAVFEEVDRIEALLSTWDAGAAVQSLNRAHPGVAVPLDRELLALLDEAERWSVHTGRAFDPTVGALVDAWDLRGEGRIPSARRLARARRASGPGTFTLDPTAGTAARHHPDAWIDTGGFGKGAALRAARAVLVERGVGAAVLDFGGQVLVLGRGGAGADGSESQRSGSGAAATDLRREVLVAHPARRRAPACRLRMTDGSVATSGASERWIEVDGERVGHLLDPRTGRPVPAWGSVTVVSDDPVAADALSTALFVLGPVEGRAWAAEREDVGVLFLEVLEDGVAPTWNRALERWLPGDGAPCVANGHDDHT